MLDWMTLSHLRSFKLGTLVGIGVAAVLYQKYPAYFDELSDRTHFVVYGGLVGGAITHAFRSRISPFFRLVVGYGRIFEAHVFLRAKLIDEPKFSELLNHLVDCHFGVAVCGDNKD